MSFLYPNPSHLQSAAEYTAKTDSKRIEQTVAAKPSKIPQFEDESNVREAFSLEHYTNPTVSNFEIKTNFPNSVSMEQRIRIMEDLAQTLEHAIEGNPLFKGLKLSVTLDGKNLSITAYTETSNMVDLTVLQQLFLRRKLVEIQNPTN
jgi:hypothetical protein